jgi:hypothetical protein
MLDEIKSLNVPLDGLQALEEEYYVPMTHRIFSTAGI